MVTRKGSAPPIPGCRPGVILFHHRAEIGCRGWTRTTTLAFKGRCPAIRRPGKQLVEPEVVATSPYPIKSRVPVCCGFSSRKNGGRARTCTSKAHSFSICGVCCSRLTTRPNTGAPKEMQNAEFGMQKSRTRARRTAHSALCILHSPLRLASLTGFAPVISCMRGRRVGWTTPQGQGRKLQAPNSKSQRSTKIQAPNFGKGTSRLSINAICAS